MAKRPAKKKKKQSDPLTVLLDLLARVDKDTGAPFGHWERRLRRPRQKFDSRPASFA